jgi:protein-S-isoprenylcysteine O-methyltransferase Ste14
MRRLARELWHPEVPMKTWIDLPPVWLALFLAVTWAIGQVLPLRFFGDAGAVVGAAQVGVGVLLMAWAAAVMTLARTTVIPHRAPSALVTSGPFRLSRNPIYLADATILTGAALWWDAALALLLVPLFMSLISRRFIQAEEERLARAFGPAWDAWALRVRRWL